MSPPRVEITMFDGEGVVSAQMKNLVEGNQVQEEEKEDEEVLIFLETLLKKQVQPTTEGLITEVLITWLIQSVLTSMSIYYMSIFKLPGRVADLLEKMMRTLLWDTGENGKGRSLVAWDLVVRSKEKGGLR